MHYAPLPQRGLIRLSGEETLPFLQGLVSNDVLQLPHKGCVYAALLSPQGKYLHDFMLVEQASAVVLDCEKARMADLHKRLMAYRLRSKVAIEMLPETMGVVALWGAGQLLQADNTQLCSDPRLAELGWRALGDIAVLTAWCQSQRMEAADEQAYDVMRLQLGVPDGSRDMTVDKSTLLPFGFEALHGVSFTKGCYVGQEVTARTKHIGQMRKCLYQITALQGTLPATGSQVYAGEELAGSLCSHQGGYGLALLAHEVVEKSLKTNVSLRCGDAELAVKRPFWWLE